MKKILTLILLLSACTPQVQEYREPGESQARLTKTAFVTHDGLELPYRSWLPKSKPKAVILALHGFNDYSHAFKIPGTYFAKQGIATYAYDQRGFGGSPQRGIWADERNLTHDASQFITLLKKRHPGVPVYLMGESMGGAAAIAALDSPDFPRVDGVILVAPAVWGGEAMNPFLRFVTWLAAHTFPSHEFTGSDLKIRASDNDEILRELGRDPLVIKSTRADTIYGLTNLMGTAYDRADRLQVPVLLLYGQKDEVIPPAPVRDAAGHLDEKAQIAYYPDGYHMLMRDLQGEVVMRDVASWIRHPKRPLPSGFGREQGEKTNPLDRKAARD